MFIGYFALLGLYYSNAFNAKTFPFMSTSIFDSTGKVYNQSFVFGPSFSLNETAYDILGQPYLTATNVWASMGQSWAVRPHLSVEFRVLTRLPRCRSAVCLRTSVCSGARTCSRRSASLGSRASRIATTRR